MYYTNQYNNIISNAKNTKLEKRLDIKILLN